MTSAIRYAYRGLVVPVFTPFISNSEKAINSYLIPRYSDYLKSKNIPGVLANGTTGEGMIMSVKERKEIAEAWSEATRKNDQHFIVQVGGTSLVDVKELARHAQSINANAILCLPELYYKPSNIEELIDYLVQVSEAAPETPLLYYHYPDMSKVQHHMGKFLQSVENRIPTLVGIKFTSTNLEEVSDALRVDDGRFVVFLGSNLIIPAGITVGIDSFMPSSTNLFPETVRAIINLSKEGDYSSAKTKQEELLQGLTRLSQLGHTLGSMKAAMSHLSPVEVGPARKPLPSYENECDQQINSCSFTPFKHSSSKCLNLSVIPQYAEYFAKHGIMGILINGTYGEGMTMTTDERIQVANAWSDTVKKTKQQLMIQVGGTNLFDVKKLAAHAQSINADSLLCLPELYYKPKTTEELIDYLKEVGEAAPKVPLYYYHSPAATGVTLKMDEFFLKVGNRVPSLAGIKFAATDLDECTRALSVAGRFKVIVANNYILPAAIVIGVDTFMPTVINVVPELVKKVYDAAISGDFAAAQKHQLEVAKIVDKLGTISEASVLSTMKAVTAYVTKLDLGPTRKPIPSFETPEKMAQVKKLAEGLFS